MSRKLLSPDGLPIFVRELGKADASKTLIIVHGYAEHGGRYVERARLFVDAGFRVLIPDVRGHGQTGGARGHVMEFGRYLDDLAVVIEHAGDTDLYLFGHSHGGLIVANWLLNREANVIRAALSSPFMGLAFDPPAWKTLIGRLLSKVAPRVSLPTEIDPEFVCSDPDVVDAYINDPDNHKVVNTRWFTEAVHAQDDALARATHLAIPTLVLQAGDDQIVSPAATERWADAAPEHNVRFELIPDAYHELWFEPEGQQHAERVLRWFLEGE